MICTCPNCQKLYETTTESANSPDRKERLCADCYKKEYCTVCHSMLVETSAGIKECMSCIHEDLFGADDERSEEEEK